MNKAPAGGLDSQLVVRERPEAPQLNIVPTREGVRDALKDESLLAGHPDATSAAQIFRAPRVVSSGTLAQVRRLAGNFARPLALAATLAACGSNEGVVQVPAQVSSDGGLVTAPVSGPVITADHSDPTPDDGLGWKGWVVLVLCSGATALALAGTGAFYGYRLLYTTKDLGAKEVGVFVRTGVLGTAAHYFNIGQDIEIRTGFPYTYMHFARKYEGGFQNTILNYPAPKEGAAENSDNDFKRVLESKNNVRHVFTWSVQASIAKGQEEKFYTNFYKKFGDKEQTGKVYDATQKALSDVVARLTFDDLPDALKKRPEISAQVQAHKQLADFARDFGLELTFILGDIEAPTSISNLAEEAAGQVLKLETATRNVEIQRKHGEAESARADGIAAGVAKIAAARTKALADRQAALGIKGDLPLVGMMALEALPDAARSFGEAFGAKSTPSTTHELDPTKKK